MKSAGCKVPYDRLQTVCEMPLLYRTYMSIARTMSDYPFYATAWSRRRRRCQNWQICYQMLFMSKVCFNRSVYKFPPEAFLNLKCQHVKLFAILADVVSPVICNRKVKHVQKTCFYSLTFLPFGHHKHYSMS